jgi:hypothetical protein
LRAEAALRRFENRVNGVEESGSDTESEEEEFIVKYVPYDFVDVSVKPEEDDEEAKRRIHDEIRGLLCCSNQPDSIDLSDTASEESIDLSQEPSRSSPDAAAAPATITCKVCTTAHSPPGPVCCGSCANVLEPDKTFSGENLDM